MGIGAFLAVGAGAALGAWLRWLLGLALDPLFPAWSLGTLAANLVGGFLIGGALGIFVHFRDLSPAWQLFIITGFLGGLTTFSSFSAEALGLLQRQHYLWFAGHLVGHVGGSLLATLAGLGLIRTLLRV